MELKHHADALAFARASDVPIASLITARVEETFFEMPMWGAVENAACLYLVHDGLSAIYINLATWWKTARIFR